MGENSLLPTGDCAVDGFSSVSLWILPGETGLSGIWDCSPLKEDSLGHQWDEHYSRKGWRTARRDLVWLPSCPASDVGKLYLWCPVHSRYWLHWPECVQGRFWDARSWGIFRETVFCIRTTKVLFFICCCLHLPLRCFKDIVFPSGTLSPSAYSWKQLHT